MLCRLFSSLFFGYSLLCFVLFFVHVPPLGWLGAMIIVSFFVCVPPLGWLGDIIIVFIIVMERVRFSVWCGCV